jgi:hypothetical protein
MAKPVLARQAAIFVLGILFPVLILAQAYVGVSSLAHNIDRSMKQEQVVDVFKRVQPLVRSPNDYALYSEMFAENVNQTIITNKQIIKVVVIEIGFAAMSLGLMFVMLGFNDGGGSAGGEGAGIKIDFKTASTGTLVFLMGAGMATAGGVLKNEYKSVPVPAYIVTGPSGPSPAETDSLEAYRTCKSSAGAEFAACFADLYGQINKEELK